MRKAAALRALPHARRSPLIRAVERQLWLRAERLLPASLKVSNGSILLKNSD
jgi:hypothetical protein